MITINDAFRKFLNEQEASLKSDTFLDCEDVILLYEEFLELVPKIVCLKRIEIFTPANTNTTIKITVIFSALSTLSHQELRTSSRTT